MPFKEFCRSVRQRFPQLAILAIPWLHGTNTRHPIAEKIAVSQSVLSSFLILVARLGWLPIRACHWGFRILWVCWLSRRNFRRLKNASFDGVAKTWFFSDLNLPPEADFYFGDLQQRLLSRQFRLLLLCGNAKEKEWRHFAGQVERGDNVFRLPDLCLLKFWQPFAMAGLQIAAALQLCRTSFKEKDDFYRKGLLLAAVDGLRSQTMLNGLHFWMGKELVRRWHPKVFLSLYEGHAWEKCLWKGVKAAEPGCKIFGYQHTVLMPRAWDLLQPMVDSKTPSIPDAVLCSGYKTLTTLQKTGLPRLIPFGSFRCQPSTGFGQGPNPLRRTILVLPEGIASEARLLFDLALAAAAMLKDHQFILRSHPALPFEQVQPFLQRRPEDLSNVEISNRLSIEEDFARASVVLYRGSSSVLYAILSGLKPFYFAPAGMENIDPLFELNGFKEPVVSHQDLAKKLNAFEKLAPKESMTAWQTAEKYVRDYTIPVSEESIGNFLKAATLH